VQVLATGACSVDRQAGTCWVHWCRRADGLSTDILTDDRPLYDDYHRLILIWWCRRRTSAVVVHLGDLRPRWPRL